MNSGRARLMLIISMVIYGTVGIFRTYIPLPSSVLALARGAIGAVFLVLFTLLTRRRPDWTVIRKKLPLLALSGALIAFNWMLLFEAYNYTTVATATMCYYMDPVFVILASPLIGERISGKKALCVLVALVGMVFVSGILSAGFQLRELAGVAFGLGAAVLYASVILLNKKIGAMNAYDKTGTQLIFAALCMLPYVLFTENVGALTLRGTPLLLTLVVGVVHTGIAYVLYFASFEKLDAQTVALYGYIDPAVAIVLSALILGQIPDGLKLLGTALILSSMMLNEIKFPLRQK